VVKFVPFSDMLKWENSFSQDAFNVVRLEDDAASANPSTSSADVELWSRIGAELTGSAVVFPGTFGSRVPTGDVAADSTSARSQLHFEFDAKAPVTTEGWQQAQRFEGSPNGKRN
jgi:hypothetical protein